MRKLELGTLRIIDKAPTVAHKTKPHHTSLRRLRPAAGWWRLRFAAAAISGGCGLRRLQLNPVTAAAAAFWARVGPQRIPGRRGDAKSWGGYK